MEQEKKLQAKDDYAKTCTRPVNYKKGDIVYLHAPSCSNLQTNTRKFVIKYVGPLIVHQVIDRTKVTVCDLDGRVIHGIYHVARLKHGNIRTESGIATHASQLPNVRTNLTEMTTKIPNNDTVHENERLKPEDDILQQCYTCQLNSPRKMKNEENREICLKKIGLHLGIPEGYFHSEDNLKLTGWYNLLYLPDERICKILSESGRVSGNTINMY